MRFGKLYEKRAKEKSKSAGDRDAGWKGIDSKKLTQRLLKMGNLSKPNGPAHQEGAEGSLSSLAGVPRGPGTVLGWEGSEGIQEARL